MYRPTTFWAFALAASVSGLCVPAGSCLAEIRPTDSAITSSLERALERDLRLRDADITVRTIAGHVRIEGEIPNLLDRFRLERLSKETDGVRRVSMRVHVQPLHERDRDLATAVDRRLRQDLLLRTKTVKVDAENRFVTIDGVVGSPVDDPDANLARKVNVKLHTDLAVDASHIEVAAGHHWWYFAEPYAAPLSAELRPGRPAL